MSTIIGCEKVFKNVAEFLMEDFWDNALYTFAAGTKGLNT